MTKKQLTVVGGICTIAAAATAASRKKKWEDVHTFAIILGALVTIAGALD